MKIAVLGGGGTGQALAAAFANGGHSVTLGIRAPIGDSLTMPRPQGKPLADWTKDTGIAVVTLQDAAAGAEVIVNATLATGSIEALTTAGVDKMSGVIVIDVANPVDFSKPFPHPNLPAYSGDTSLGEQIQAAFPLARVVKAFNTLGVQVMVDPGLIGEPHDLFVAANDAQAKAVVMDLARSLGWTRLQDMGDIKGARAMEMFILIWLQIMSVTNGSLHNLHVAQA
jgi:predicted dinucleotide-binding enzyme